MAIPPPMPHPNDDPDHVAARASKRTFTEEANKVRSQYIGASDLLEAEKIKTLYDTHVQEIAAAYERLTTRRRTRLEYLESLVPIGPNVPEGTSPADRSVLLKGFREEYGKAKRATAKERAEQLANAERFDDDTLRRGVLTAAMDLSDMALIKQWSEQHLDTAGNLDEVATLRAVLAGQHFNSLWDAQDFKPLPVPQEVNELPRLQAAAEAVRQARVNR